MQFPILTQASGKILQGKGRNKALLNKDKDPQVLT